LPSPGHLDAPVRSPLSDLAAGEPDHPPADRIVGLGSK